MNNPKYRNCQRCNSEFECKVDTINLCQCSTIKLTREEQNHISERFNDCLCASCMKELKTEYHKNISK